MAIDPKAIRIGTMIRGHEPDPVGYLEKSCRTALKASSPISGRR